MVLNLFFSTTILSCAAWFGSDHTRGFVGVRFEFWPGDSKVYFDPTTEVSVEGGRALECPKKDRKLIERFRVLLRFDWSLCCNN